MTRCSFVNPDARAQALVATMPPPEGPRAHGSRALHPFPAHSARRPAPAAFTLIELLTVITIIVIVLAITAPMISAVRRAGGANSAVNTISAAIGTAQAWARGSRQTYTYNTTVNPPTTIEPYLGMALLFVNNTPPNLLNPTHPGQTILRLVQNTDPSGTLNTYTPGYTDVPQWEPMTLPGGTAIFGITTASAGANAPMQLVSPPFAVCFDPSGNLIFSTTTVSSGNPWSTVQSATNQIYADLSTTFSANYSANGTYNPANYASPPIIPTVIGVVVYSPLAVNTAVPVNTPALPPPNGTLAIPKLSINASSGTVITDATAPSVQQVLQYGQIIWFSRTSGIMNKVQRQ